MPVALVTSSAARAPHVSSPLRSSTSSLSSSITASQAKSLYNQAARNFLHRRHVEAILTAEKALLAFQTEALQDRNLAERLIILRLTLLATIYRPSKVEQKVELFSQLKASGKLSVQDKAAILTLENLLALPTLLFLTRLWVDVLRFYVEVLPRLSSIQARAPLGSTTSLSPEPDTLPAALQPPAGVVAAAIMGALRIDDEESKDNKVGEGSQSVKGKKEAKSIQPKTEADMGKGLQAAKMMSEWVMSAHSKMMGGYNSLNSIEVDYLYQQHSRVLQLYTLHILGTRLGQWELANQVARCAVEIREDEQELQDRQSLLDQLASAQAHISSRGERRRIASEKARQRYEVEKAKRAASAEQQAKGPSIETEKQDKTTSVMSPVSVPISEKPPRLRRSDSGVSNASSSTSASELESEGGIPSRRSTSGKNRNTVETSKAGADYAEKRELISHHLDRQHKRDEKSLDWTSRDRGALVQDRLLAWLRSVGGNPGLLVRYLSAIVATLFIVRRALRPAHSRAPTTTVPATRLTSAETTRSRLEQTKRQDESLIMTGIRKVWSTLRM